MMISIEREAYDKLGFNLDQAVADFTAAKEAHKLTVNVPAPTAQPLVEAVYNGGGYIIVEGETGLPATDANSLTSRIAALEAKVTILETKNL